MPLTLDWVIDTHFKGEKTLYFHQSDAHRMEAGDTYLKYYWKGAGRVSLWMGGSEGEMPILVTSDPMALNKMIEIITTGK